jgi:hypothetical protein
MASDFIVPKTVRGMIVDHADGLHECIADCGTDETEPVFLKIFAYFVGKICLCRDVGNGFPLVLNRDPVDMAPEKGVEGSEFFDNIKGLGNK